MFNEKIVKQDQERNRLLQLWNNERQFVGGTVRLAFNYVFIVLYHTSGFVEMVKIG